MSSFGNLLLTTFIFFFPAPSAWAFSYVASLAFQPGV
jgi:hypothetical protein